MKPAAHGASAARTPREPRAEALRILRRVRQGDNSSVLLERARLEPGVDRALATELVLGVLRQTDALDVAIAGVSKRRLSGIDGDILEVLRLGAYQLLFLDRIPAHAAVSTSVALARDLLLTRRTHRAGFVNAVLRRLAEGRADGSVPRASRLPAFLADRWRQRFGAEVLAAMEKAACGRARVHLRVVRGEVEEAVACLARDGVVVRRGELSPRCLIVEGGTAVRSRALREGRVWVQDEAAQLVSELVQPAAGQRILDACASPGGKTVAMASLAHGSALIVAAELGVKRAMRLSANLSAAGVTGAHPIIMDATRPSLAAGFDRILVDAPCSSTGTLRRNPEVRDRVDEASLARSAARARAILAGVLPLLKPGGRLVYATCSLEPEENDEVIAGLLAAHGDLTRVDPRPALAEGARRLVGDDLVLRTHPGALEVDGFTAVVLERKP